MDTKTVAKEFRVSEVLFQNIEIVFWGMKLLSKHKDKVSRY